LESLVGRRQDAEVTKRYSAGLSDAFREVARVLKPDGLLVFTFRHAVADAWYALAVALARAGLRATQFFPAPGEAGVGLHVHEGTGLWDTVFVLRKMKLKGAHDLRVSQAGKEHVKVTVATWAEKLTRARLPFTDVDQLALYRAGLVAIALGLLGDPLGPGADPLQHLLCASTQ
jgi:adenine-specific DNA methylase